MGAINIILPTPDAKLHRLELTDAEVRLLIRVINYAIGSGGMSRTAGSLTQGRLLTLRGLMERSKPT
jgi:hypothetical protein